MNKTICIYEQKTHFFIRDKYFLSFQIFFESRSPSSVTKIIDQIKQPVVLAKSFKRVCSTDNFGSVKFSPSC